MKFRERLKELNPSWKIPSGYNRYGQVMILRSQEELSQELGEGILGMYSWCESVYQHHNTKGESRIPLLRLLAGIDNPQVLHKENGVLYDLDLSKITFSGGNRRLREQLVKEIQPGEHLLDMFAAVGNLSLQPLVHLDIEGTLIEQNPYTFTHLQSSLKLNNLDPGLAVNMDCRMFEGNNVADRLFLGYHDIDATHLKTAINLAKSEAYLHLHPIISSNHRSDELYRYESMVSSFPIQIEDVRHHKVKDYAPNLEHHELILQISK